MLRVKAAAVPEELADVVRRATGLRVDRIEAAGGRSKTAWCGPAIRVTPPRTIEIVIKRGLVASIAKGTRYSYNNRILSSRRLARTGSDTGGITISL